MRYRPLVDRIRMAVNLEGDHFRHGRRHRITAVAFEDPDDHVARRIINVRCRCGHQVHTWRHVLDLTPRMKHGPRRAT